MCELLDRPREQVLGRGVFEFFTGESRRTLDEQLAARAQGLAGAYEIVIDRPDGSRRRCVNNATPLYDEQGRRIGSIGIWTDLTERLESARQLRIYEAVSECADRTGLRWWMTRAATAWSTMPGAASWACRASRRWGRDAADTTPHAATPERRQALEECLATGRPRMLREPSEHPLHADRWIEIGFYPDRGGRRTAPAPRSWSRAT